MGEKLQTSCPTSLYPSSSLACTFPRLLNTWISHLAVLSGNLSSTCNFLSSKWKHSLVWTSQVMDDAENNCHNAIHLNMCTTVEGNTSRASETEYYIDYKLLKNYFPTWDNIYLHCAFNKNEINVMITMLVTQVKWVNSHMALYYWAYFTFTYKWNLNTMKTNYSIPEENAAQKCNLLPPRRHVKC
jgi:hypothetical protein